MEVASTLPKVDGNTEAVPNGVLGSPMVLQGCLRDGGLGKEVLGAVLLSRAKGSTRLQSPQKIIRF